MRIGWIGTGVMGNPMCQHLIRKWVSRNPSHEMYVYNRTSSKADSIVSAGGIFSSPVKMAKMCDIIFMMLGYPQDVKNITLNEESGLLNFMKRGSILVDHTTSSPALAKEIHVRAKENGIVSVDAPVSGGDVGAREGKLVIMLGGIEPKELQLISPFMSILL